MFGLIKKMLLIVLSCVNLLSTTLLSSVLMNSQECKVGPEIINVNSNEPVFYPFSLKQVNAVVVVTISMIHIQRFVFLML